MTHDSCLVTRYFTTEGTNVSHNTDIRQQYAYDMDTVHHMLPWLLAEQGMANRRCAHDHAASNTNFSKH